MTAAAMAAKTGWSPTAITCRLAASLPSSASPTPPTGSRPHHVNSQCFVAGLHVDAEVTSAFSTTAKKGARTTTTAADGAGGNMSTGWRGGGGRGDGGRIEAGRAGYAGRLPAPEARIICTVASCTLFMAAARESSWDWARAALPRILSTTSASVELGRGKPEPGRLRGRPPGSPVLEAVAARSWAMKATRQGETKHRSPGQPPAAEPVGHRKRVRTVPTNSPAPSPRGRTAYPTFTSAMVATSAC